MTGGAKYLCRAAFYSGVMGVRHLWDVVQDVGEAVALSALANATIAIDASIWIAQLNKRFSADFLDMNKASLKALVRRLCLLLHFKIKPVFVFDGRASSLKRSTLNKRLASELRQSERRVQKLARQMLHHSVAFPSSVGFNSGETLLDDTFAGKHVDRLGPLAQAKSASVDGNANEIQRRLQQLLAQHHDKPQAVKKSQHVATHDSSHSTSTADDAASSSALFPECRLESDGNPAAVSDSRSSSASSNFDSASISAKRAEYKDLTSMAGFMPDTPPKATPMPNEILDGIEPAPLPAAEPTAPFLLQPYSSPARVAPGARNAVADNPNDHLLLPIKRILSILGIPFITAPADAEAQCAFLGENNVVDYVSTEDSDVFLFGKANVVRHLFSARNAPVLFKSSSIAEQLGLDRFRLISFAMLVGCDYTQGLPTVGKAKALRVLKSSAFDNMANAEDCVQCLARQFPRCDGVQSFPEASVIEYFSSPLVNADLRQFIWEKPNQKDFEGFLSADLGLCAAEVAQLSKLASSI